MAPRARFELATLRLTADEVKNPSALSARVAYRETAIIFPFFAEPNPAPKEHSQTGHAAPGCLLPVHEI